MLFCENMLLDIFFIFQEKQPFERIEVSRNQALELFSENSFKVSEAPFLYHPHHLTPSLATSLFSYYSDPHSYGLFIISLNQIEIINDLPEDKTITVYRCGPLVDLCRGPHIPNTSFVKAFACLKVCCVCSWELISFVLANLFSVLLRRL